HPVPEPNPTLPPSPSPDLAPPMSHPQTRTQGVVRAPTPLTIRLARITPTTQLAPTPSPPSRHKRMEPDPTKEEPMDEERKGEGSGSKPNQEPNNSSVTKQTRHTSAPPKRT